MIIVNLDDAWGTGSDSMSKTFPSINLRGERDMMSIPLKKSDLDNLGTDGVVRFGEPEGWQQAIDDL